MTTSVAIQQYTPFTIVAPESTPGICSISVSRTVNQNALLQHTIQDSYFVSLLYKGQHDASKNKPHSPLRKEGAARIKLVRNYFGNFAKSMVHKVPYFWTDATFERNAAWIFFTPNAFRDAVYDGFSSSEQCEMLDMYAPQQYPITINMVQGTKRDEVYSLEIELEYSMDNVKPLVQIDFQKQVMKALIRLYSTCKILHIGHKKPDSVPVPSSNGLALDQIRDERKARSGIKYFNNKLMAIDFSLKILVGKLNNDNPFQPAQDRFSEVERAERRIIASYSVIETALQSVKFDHTCPSLFSEQLFGTIKKIQAGVRLGNSKKLSEILGASRLCAYADDMMDFF